MTNHTLLNVGVTLILLSAIGSPFISNYKILQDRQQPQFTQPQQQPQYPYQYQQPQPQRPLNNNLSLNRPLNNNPLNNNPLNNNPLNNNPLNNNPLNNNPLNNNLILDGNRQRHDSYHLNNNPLLDS